MSYTDFEYNGLRLSDFGCMVCSFGGGGELKTSSMGSNLTLNTITDKNNNFTIISTEYGEAYSEPFQICKKNCHGNDMSFSHSELSKIMRWLNKRSYFKFKPIFDNDTNIYYMGTFNIQKITLAGNVVGLELTFIADAPFGYYENNDFVMDFSDITKNYMLYDMSDEVGYIYPSYLEIKCLANGTLRINNSQENKVVEIKNCVNGEIITLDGKNKIIQTNVAHKGLYNDFNYNFVKVIRKEIIEDGYEDENSNLNIYSVSLPCIIKLVYSPICKLGVL